MAKNPTHDERNARLIRIVEAFNGYRYNAEGICMTPMDGKHKDTVRADILAMLNDPRSDYVRTGKAATLALEVSQIVQCIGNMPARQHFHRILQFI